jgi:hypothetical protein
MTSVIAATYFKQIKKLLEAAKSDNALFEVIVNAPFTDRVKVTNIDLGIIVLLLVNTKSQTINRIALSNTELAKGAVKMSAKPFKAIKIPVGYRDNIVAEAIRTNKPRTTGDWQYLFVPALTASQARLNQSGAGIECSLVYPLAARDGGALIFSFFQPPHNISEKHRTFADMYTELVDTALMC